MTLCCHCIRVEMSKSCLQQLLPSSNPQGCSRSCKLFYLKRRNDMFVFPVTHVLKSIASSQQVHSAKESRRALQHLHCNIRDDGRSGRQQVHRLWHVECGDSLPKVPKPISSLFCPFLAAFSPYSALKLCLRVRTSRFGLLRSFHLRCFQVAEMATN